MKTGIIRRRGKNEIIGTWRADQQSLVVETDNPELRKAADEILKTPQCQRGRGSQRGRVVTIKILKGVKLKYLIGVRLS
jgi:hypothetical protein